jgi:outer membrane receptor protein involved in Fe transport
MAALRTVLLGCLLGVIFLSTATGAEPVRLSADIAPRPLTEALAAFGRQTGLQLIYVSSVAETQHSNGAPAGLAAPAALAQLLDGTGLTFEFLNARTVRIYAAPTILPTLTPSSPPAPHGVAQARAVGLEEVVVSGARGQELLSRVPIDMAVWTEEAMEVSHIKGIAEIAALTPGVVFGFSPITGDLYTDLVIRGVTSRHGVAVGVYVDDSPIPPNRAATYLTSFPLAFDLNRVEILRGPQTVLLGDHALSGAVRFIPNQPSLTTSTGLFRAEWGTTQYGSPSYEAGAAVGGPIVTDELGFRVSGWFREDGGYVDRVDASPYEAYPNVILDKDSNRHVNKVVRGALTFAPAAGVQITPSLMYQSIYIHDLSAFDTTISDPAHGVFKYPSPLQQPWEQSYYLASLKLTARSRAAELSAMISYFNQRGSFHTDYFDSADELAANLFGLEQRAPRAEVRLTSLDPDAVLTWVTGVLTSREHARHAYQSTESGNGVTVTDQNQLAGFGQITLKVTKDLTASAGVRVGHWTYDSVSESPSTFRAGDSDTWAAPQFGLSWQADPHDLLYLTVAQGYGSGGVSPQGPTDPPGVAPPAPYPPDTLWSYEIGSKHSLRDGRLRLEMSVFHINWNDGPAVSGNNEQGAIPGSAVSNGFDFLTEALVGNHAKVALNLAYTDAHATQTVKGFVTRGDALPVSPWNVTASFERGFPLRPNLTASVRIEDAFRSAPGPTYLDNPANAPSGFYTPGSADPSANVLNLRAAVTWSDFELAAFLSNALNSHPLLTGRSAAVTSLGAPFVVTLVPRTLSISGSWRY